MAFAGIGGGAPTLNTGPAQGYINTLGNIANSQGQQAGSQWNQFNANNAQNQNAIQNYSNYLTSNPATNQYNAEQTAKADQYANQSAAGATANLDASLAQRGISPNSSAGVGGLANIQEGLAANNANIQAQQGMNNEAQHAQNLGLNSQLLTNNANNTFGQANTLTGNQTGINQNLFSDANTLAQEQYQGQLAQQADQAQLVSGLASAAGSIYTGGFSPAALAKAKGS